MSNGAFGVLSEVVVVELVLYGFEFRLAMSRPSEHPHSLIEDVVNGVIGRSRLWGVRGVGQSNGSVVLVRHSLTKEVVASC